MHRKASVSCLVVICVALWIVGCQSIPQQSAVLTHELTPIYSGEYYDTLAQQIADPQKKGQYQLLAVRAYYKEGRTEQAYQRLARMSQEIRWPPLLMDVQLVHARLLSEEGQYTQALAVLNMDVNSRPPEMQRYWHQEKMRLYDLSKQNLLAAREAIWLHPFLDKQQQRDNEEGIWSRLSGLSSFTLRSYQSGDVYDPVSGWFELAAILNDHTAENLQTLQTELEQWSVRYADHPAQDRMKARLASLSAVKDYQPKYIGVLLPLSGPYQQQAFALQAGILSAFKKASHTAVNISFYDTHDQSMNQIARQLQADNIDFVLGPLLKSDMRDYLQEGLHIESLILNEPEQTMRGVRDQHYFFSISLQHELEQAAERMILENYRSPLIFAPDTLVNRKHIAAFQARWQKRYDTPAQTVFYTEFNQIESAVKRGLGIEESLSRIQDVQELLGLPLEIEPRSRRDIDVVYLLGNPQETRMLKSFIDVSINTSAKPPRVFASSRSFDVSLSAVNSLRDIMFTEMPGFAGEHHPALQQAKTLWPAFDSQQWRLFAMGYDAFDVVHHLIRMCVIPTYRFEGITGALQVKSDRILHRALTWGTYQQSGIFAYVPDL